MSIGVASQPGAACPGLAQRIPQAAQGPAQKESGLIRPERRSFAIFLAMSFFLIAINPSAQLPISLCA